MLFSSLSSFCGTRDLWTQTSIFSPSAQQANSSGKAYFLWKKSTIIRAAAWGARAPRAWRSREWSARCLCYLEPLVCAWSTSHWLLWEKHLTPATTEYRHLTGFSPAKKRSSCGAYEEFAAKFSISTYASVRFQKRKQLLQFLVLSS